MVSLPRPVATLWRSLRLPTHKHALGWWLGTRTTIFVVWILIGFNTQGDVAYYYSQIDLLFHGTPPDQILIEYPTPLIWFLTLPYLLGFGSSQGYLAVFVLFFLGADALLGFILWRSARQYGTTPRPAVAYWIWFVVATGPIIYMRLDFLTSALGALGLIALIRAHRGASGALMGLGAAIKLWPALLWPATLTDRRALRQATLGFFAVGTGLAVASLLYGGWQRLISPLTWQSQRGLHIESICATPVMVSRLYDTSTPQRWTVFLSKFNAWEITGPGTTLLTDISSTLVILGGITMAVLYLGWLKRTDRNIVEAGILMIVATLIMIVTNKTLSPQYIIWLSGPIAALLTISEIHPRILPAQGHLFSLITHPPHLRREDRLVIPVGLARHLAIWSLILAILTQVIYPVLYRHYIVTSMMTPIAAGVLVVRNVALVYFTISLVVFSFRSIGFRVNR